MSRLVMSLMEAIGLSFCVHGRKALQGYANFGDALHSVADATLKELRKHMPADQIRVALAETAALPPAEYASMLDGIMKTLCRVQSVPFREELHEYLSYLPLTIQQMFHRPSDVAGHSAPAKLEFYKAEQLLPYLPPRRPHFKPGSKPDGLDNWELRELVGLGECGEVWAGYDDEDPENSPAALKFAIDKESKKRFLAAAPLFEKTFELNDINGIVPLRGVYLQSDPPCLEYAYCSGYDLTGMLHEWSWKHAEPQVAMAGKFIKRIASVVGKAHDLGVVHRDLKPSNVLIHPTHDGKFTLWITDFGWGQIESERSLQLHRSGGTPAPEQKRLALRGAYTPLYASPQQSKNEPPHPTDDVHALGVIWFQMLKRDPHVSAPIGDEWAEEFLTHGLSPAHAKLLSACVATRPDKRPASATAFLQMLNAEPVAEVSTGTKTFVFHASGSSSTHTPVGGTAVATAPAKVAVGSVTHVKSTLLGATAFHPIKKESGTFTKVVRNSISMSFVPIAAGTFDMGADNDEIGRHPDETPKHTVRIPHAFFMSVYPVTQAQFERLMGRNPSFFNQRNHGSPEYPVESVSWMDADKFCKKLTRYGDEDVYGRIYRLPTEAEWEYCCRAGTTTPFHYGETLHPENAHYAAMIHKGQGHPCVIGQHLPNAWGLHDMHGNVEEWCSDWYAGDYYFDSPGTDPRGPLKGEHRVIRGGDWAGCDKECRSASRRHQHPDKPMNTLGFRVVMVTPGR